MLKGNKLVLPWPFPIQTTSQSKKKNIRKTKEGGTTCQLAAMLPDQDKRGQRNGHLNSWPKNGEQPHLDLYNWEGFFMRVKTVCRWLTPLVRCFYLLPIHVGDLSLLQNVSHVKEQFGSELVCLLQISSYKIEMPIAPNLQPPILNEGSRVFFTTCLLFPAQSFMSKEEAVHIKWKVYSIHLVKQSERPM